MKYEKLTAIGNPVDDWWNTIRPEIKACITMLGQYPPVRDQHEAREMMPTVRRAHQYVRDADYPPQAEQIRQYLLDSLYELTQTLKELILFTELKSDNSYNIAYHNYMMVIHMLLQRGIYEPDPGDIRRTRAY